MRRSLKVAAFAALLAATVVPVHAQSLGEAAAKEQKRRKAQKAPAKVYTDSDVRTVPPDAAPPADGATTPSGDKPAGEATQPEKSSDEQRAEDRKAWLDQHDKAKADVERLTADVATYEAQANDTRGYLYGNRHAVAVENLEKAKKDLAAAQQRYDDVVEAGRRKGFQPPR